MTLLAPTDLPLAGVVTNVDPLMLQMLLDSAEDEIVARRGPVGGPITEVHLGRTRLFGLLRPASGIAGITTITEIDQGGLRTLLDTTDWLLYPNLRTLVRLPYGNHLADRWAYGVEVVFTPRDDTAQRKRVQLGLVKLDLAYSGFGSLSTQTESRGSLANYHLERAALLASFALTDERAF